MSGEPLLPISQVENSGATRRSQPSSSPESSSSEAALMDDHQSFTRRILATDSSSSDLASTQPGRSQLNTVLIRAQLVPLEKKILALIITGTILGCSVPKNENLPTLPVRYLSSIIGYIYFLCWSISFYPQVMLNYTRKTTTGLSADFSILNVVGFACYTTYATSFFFSSTIKKEYKERNSDSENSVQSNDVAFAFHALLLSSVQMWQIVLYNINNNKSTWEQLSIWTRYFITFSSILCFGFPLLILSGFDFQWLDYLYILSSIKLTITIIKYIPQVLMNYKRKSTIGWNIWNILLDFAGGTLSLAQLIIDATDMHDFSAITGNWVKFGLSLVSILFDIIFMLQHYILYRIFSHRAEPTPVI